MWPVLREPTVLKDYCLFVITTSVWIQGLNLKGEKKICHLLSPMCSVGIEQKQLPEKKSLGHFTFFSRKHLVGTQQSNFQENTQALTFSAPFRIHVVNFGA